MKEIDKFEHLLSHWIEHNRSHEEGYRKWIQRAEDAGRHDVAQEIERSMNLSRDMNRSFEKAIQLLKGNQDV